MAQGNHFLTIPKQEGLFMTIKSGRAGDTREDSPVEDEDEEETEEEVRFIPRCSPVPRKRGPSITDETAEYMRIRLALPQRRVSFADASGGELVDVREFAAFDSADEEDNANWEDEEAKYRRAYLQPVYRVWPEFRAHTGNDLTLAVHANKVEVEKVAAVHDDPLAFDVLICVLNVSYHKCVYVRSTMDGWITQTDIAAEYVQGSHCGDIDKFLLRLSFAEPYLFNGARIDFVVRYETSDGEFWANNSGRNYSVTLVVSYEEDKGPVNTVDEEDIKGILKPPRYRDEDDSDFYPDTDDGNEDNTKREAAAEIPLPMCPLVIEPEIDIEIPEALSSPFKTRGDPTIEENPLASTNKQDERTLHDLLECPQQKQDLEKSHGTGLIIPTVNITMSIQKEAQDNDPAFNSMSNQTICTNQDNPQSDTGVQGLFDLNITLPAMFLGSQNMEEDDSEKFKDHVENDEILSGERRVAQLRDQISDTIEVDNTEFSLKELQESTKQCSLNELITASVSEGKGDCSHSIGHDILFQGSHEPLLENPEVQMIRHDTMIGSEIIGKEQTSLRVEAPDMTASCIWQPFEPTILGQIREDSIIQNVPSPPGTCALEVTEYQQQGQKPESALKEVPDVHYVSIETPSGFESTAPKEGQIITSLYNITATSQCLTTTVQAVAHEDGAGKPSLTQEEPLSNEVLELYHDDSASFQIQEGLESQLSLPLKTLDTSNAELDVILGNTLIPSFAFLSVAVCLMVGFHEPSIFLIMAVFLVSLCL